MNEASLKRLAKYIVSRGDAKLPEILVSSTGNDKNHEKIIRSLNVGPEWTAALTNIVAAQDSTKQPEDSLIEAIKVLTKIASHEKLWAARVLARVCTALASAAVTSGNPAAMDAASTAIRQAFRVVVTDYEDEEPQEGRTLECYTVAVCLLRLYVRMHAYSLAEGIMSAINGYSGNIAPLSKSSPQVQTQFLFYKGMLAFYEQKYGVSCECLSTALKTSMTPVQLEHTMAYLILAKFLVENRVPTPELWSTIPRLRELYAPLLAATRRGDYAAYKSHMKTHADTLRKNRLYLACDVLLPRLRLNLLRRCWELLGRPKRVPVDIYAVALQVAGFDPATSEAAEFYMSQFILRGQLKGYIHHDLQLLMVSKTQPFPTLVKPTNTNT